MKNSEILTKHWQKGSNGKNLDETVRFSGEIEKGSINGMVMDLKAVENLSAGQIVFLNGNAIGVALQRADALEVVPVIMSGTFKLNGEWRRV